MRPAASAALALAAAVAVGTQAAASEATGVWRAPSHDALIEVYDCGAALCGRVVSSDQLRLHPDQRDVHNADPAKRNRPVAGMVMMSGFVGGPPRWRGGQFYNPNDGRSYPGDVSMDRPDRIEITGCLIRPLCLTQTWLRER